MPPWPKNSHIFGLDLENLGFVVTKWRQRVTMSTTAFLDSEKKCDVTVL
jgi:hypothetical protein